MSKIAVLCPAFNEADNLPDLISATARVWKHDLVLLNDGSVDDTGDCAESESPRKWITVHHPRNRGYGAALRTLFAHAQQNDYDWVITMDADLQHDPMALPRFVELSAREGADIVSGSRYGDRDSSTVRSVFKHMASSLSRIT